MEEKEGTLWGLETGLSGLPLGSHDKLRLCRWLMIFQAGPLAPLH